MPRIRRFSSMRFTRRGAAKRVTGRSGRIGRFGRFEGSEGSGVRTSLLALAAPVLVVLSAVSGALAFEVEPATPTRCDEILVIAERAFSSDCGWSATPQVSVDAARIDVSLALHAASEICLPVARERVFRVPIGAFPPGDYTLVVAWSDLDQLPEEIPIRIGDEVCPDAILRGDSNRDDSVDIADVVHILLRLFAGGAAPDCEAAADVDADGEHALTDAVYLLEYLFLSGFAPPPLSKAEATACSAPRDFLFSSEAFADGEAIPIRHSCEGQNLSPPLAWSGTPAGTRSLALTCLDPDAPSGTFVHWLAWNIPASTTSLGEAEIPPAEGTNGAGRVGYTGPCPPRGGGAHRYVFTLHALDVETLPLDSTARREAFETVLEGHGLGTAQVMGTYLRE